MSNSTFPIPFFGFVNIGRQIYRFLGLLELLRHYQERQVDGKRKLRTVWLFELRIHDTPGNSIPIAGAAAISTSLLERSRRTQPLGTSEREIVSLASPSNDEAALATAETVRMLLLEFTPYDFEHFIKHVLGVGGFVRVSVTGRLETAASMRIAYVDEGNEFFAGTHLQAQGEARWRHAVGSPEINNFRGALNTTAKGVFITTNHFTRAAVVEARHDSKPSIALIDGDKLAAIVIRTGALK